jgi:hypothetical protein
MRSTVEVRRTGARRPTCRAPVSALNPLLRSDTSVCSPSVGSGQHLSAARTSRFVTSFGCAPVDKRAYLLSNVDHRIVDKLTIDR